MLRFGRLHRWVSGVKLIGNDSSFPRCRCTTVQFMSCERHASTSRSQSLAFYPHPGSPLPKAWCTPTSRPNLFTFHSKRTCNVRNTHGTGWRTHILIRYLCTYRLFGKFPPVVSSKHASKHLSWRIIVESPDIIGEAYEGYGNVVIPIIPYTSPSQVCLNSVSEWASRVTPLPDFATARTRATLGFPRPVILDSIIHICIVLYLRWTAVYSILSYRELELVFADRSWICEAIPAPSNYAVSHTSADYDSVTFTDCYVSHRISF